VGGTESYLRQYGESFVSEGAFVSIRAMARWAASPLAIWAVAFELGAY